MTLGVRAIALDSEGRVLLVKHTYVEGWHLPGGGVENGQTVVQALERELSEEANVELTEAPQLLSVHHNNNTTRRDHVVLFVCRGVMQTAPKVRDREIVDARFFALGDLPSDATTATDRRIREFREKLDPDPYW